MQRRQPILHKYLQLNDPYGQREVLFSPSSSDIICALCIAKLPVCAAFHAIPSHTLDAEVRSSRVPRRAWLMTARPRCPRLVRAANAQTRSHDHL